VPVIVGSSIGASRAAERLFRRGVNVQPILYPAGRSGGAVRFFLSSLHTREQIERAERDAVAVRGAGGEGGRLGAARALGDGR